MNISGSKLALAVEGDCGTDCREDVALAKSHKAIERQISISYALPLERTRDPQYSSAVEG
jgi:hypothetical protein